MMNYKKPKRYFEKSGVVDPKASYYVSMENVTNMDKPEIIRTPEKAVGKQFNVTNAQSLAGNCFDKLVNILF